MIDRAAIAVIGARLRTVVGVHVAAHTAGLRGVTDAAAKLITRPVAGGALDAAGPAQAVGLLGALALEAAARTVPGPACGAIACASATVGSAVVMASALPVAAAVPTGL